MKTEQNRSKNGRKMNAFTFSWDCYGEFRPILALLSTTLSPHIQNSTNNCDAQKSFPTICEFSAFNTQKFKIILRKYVNFCILCWVALKTRTTASILFSKSENFRQSYGLSLTNVIHKSQINIGPMCVVKLQNGQFYRKLL